MFRCHLYLILDHNMFKIMFRYVFSFSIISKFAYFLSYPHINLIIL
ncbi:MAG: hypothetical protein ACKPKO_05765 [Candidatus Fonsibacter sp.]